MKLTKMSTALVLATATLGCNGAEDSTSQPVTRSLASNLAPVQMSLPARDPAAVLGMTAGIVEVLLGRDVGAATSLAAFSSALGGGDQGVPVDAQLNDDAKVAVGFDRVSRQWAMNAAVTRNVDASAPDIGRSGAEAVFRHTVDALEAKGVILKADYDLNSISVRTLRAGVRGPDGTAKEWVKEYFFVAPRKVEGIEVLDAGLEIAVHRSGSLSRVFVGGPVIEVGEPRFSQAVSTAELDARFGRDFPNSKLHWSGVRYVFSGSEGLSRPRQVYKFSGLANVNGIQVESRAQFASYSLESPSEPAHVWPKHDASKVGGDPRPGG